MSNNKKQPAIPFDMSQLPPELAAMIQANNEAVAKAQQAAQEAQEEARRAREEAANAKAQLEAKKPQGTDQLYNSIIRTDNGDLMINLPSQVTITKSGAVTVKLARGKFKQPVRFTADQRKVFFTYLETCIGGKLATRLDDLRLHAEPWSPSKKDTAEATSVPSTFSLSEV